MKNFTVLSLILCAPIFTSCITPGLKEPKILLCASADGETFECRDPREPDDVVALLNRFEAIGYISASPEDFAELKSHHEALHAELNRCKEK